jgi:ribosomal protein L17
MAPFKIGSRMPGAPVVPTTTTARAPAKETSAGFPLIEHMVEKEDFEAFNARYREHTQRLERIIESGKDDAVVAAAQKSLRAMDRTVNLLEELMDIKAKMLAGDDDDDEDDEA